MSMGGSSSSRMTRAELLIRAQVADAINRILQETMRCETVEAVAAACLAVAEELTGAQFGFIGELNASGNFDSYAISDTGWGACRIEKTQALAALADLPVRGIWGRVLKDSKPVLSNDPEAHPDSTGVPEGHPLLTSFVGVPVLQRGKATGMIALANKKGGFTQLDLDNVEKLVDAFCECVARKRLELELRTATAVVEDIAVERSRLLLESEERYEAIAHNLPRGIVHIFDSDLRYLFNSGKELARVGLTNEMLVGKSIHDVLPPDLAVMVEREYRKVLQGETVAFEGDFGEQAFLVTAAPLRNEAGEVVQILALSVNVTERKAAEQEVRRLNRELEERVALQSRSILELSTPALSVMDHLVLMPLVGILDTHRAQQLMENLLEAVVASEALVVILDVTGVPTIDTSVAFHLLKVVQATRMLGAEVIVTGFSPEIVQTLARLGLDLAVLRTAGTLRGGLAEALHLLGKRIESD